jgi:hypothetical protein
MKYVFRPSSIRHRSVCGSWCKECTATVDIRGYWSAYSPSTVSDKYGFRAFCGVSR